MPHNQSNHYLCQPGDTVGFFWTRGQGMTPSAEMQSMSFVFLRVCLSILARLHHYFQSPFSYPVFQTSRRRFATMLPTSFASPPNSSHPSVLEVICHNLAVIRETPPPPAVGSSLGNACALAQGMGRILSSKFDVQASGELICLVVASCLWVTRGGGGFHCHGTLVGHFV